MKEASRLIHEGEELVMEMPQVALFQIYLIGGLPLTRYRVVPSLLWRRAFPCLDQTHRQARPTLRSSPPGQILIAAHSTTASTHLRIVKKQQTCVAKFCTSTLVRPVGLVSSKHKLRKTDNIASGTQLGNSTSTPTLWSSLLWHS
jgi:hypothetical protein